MALAALTDPVAANDTARIDLASRYLKLFLEDPDDVSEAAE
jgi:hypothetical protein